MSAHVETIRGYAIKLPRKGNLAINGDGMPRVFHRLYQADELRKGLIPHCGRGKVVRVTVTITEDWK